MKKILSIDGGGIRGIVPAVILSKIEKVTGKPIAKLFDLIAGTSTGGIIACGLGSGISADDLVQMYVANGKRIFTKDLWRPDLFYPKYKNDGIDTILEEVFKDRSFSDSLTKILIPTYDMEEDTPHHFKSWKNRREMTMVRVCRATSAAPTFFSSAEDRYIDGGVFSNNPTMDAMVEAHKMWPEDKLWVLSLGTGFKRGKNGIIKAGGIKQWAFRIFSLLMEGPVENVEYQSKYLLGENCIRVSEPLPDKVNSAMDDASMVNVDRLAAFGEYLSEGEQVKKAIEILKG